jgi:phosphatidylglycerophosphate synthase
VGTSPASPPGHPTGRRAPPPWLPNAISFARIALIPAFLGFAEATRTAAEAGLPETAERILAALTLVAIGLSDVLDGYLARRYHLGTPLGAVLDAVADKLAQVSLVAYFTLRDSAAFEQIPLWFLLLLVARDLVLASGSLLVRRRHGAVDVEHKVHGKLVSLLQFALLLAITLGLGRLGVLLGVVAVAVLTVPSTLGYVRHGIRQWRR